MLQVDPADRPSCDEILSMPLIKKIAHKLALSKDSNGHTIPTKAELMKTIKLPRNLKVPITTTYLNLSRPLVSEEVAAQAQLREG